MDLGLGRVQALLRRVGSPQMHFPVIHVAGTNGKGSTTAYLDAFLTHAAGLRPVRFNTPHLRTARDSVRRHGGLPIDEDIWNLAVQKTRTADASDVPIGATPFELLTVQALLACTLLPEASRPDLLLIEVGVGGRLDATNVFPSENVLASVICPIARDHETLLGDTLTDIAREKAGIVKQHGLCVIADQGIVSESFTETDSIAVLNTLQDVCNAQHARAVYTRVPWSKLHPHSEPGCFSSRVELEQTLAGTPEGHVCIPLEATLARITGASTALQTLWSIAHDHPTSDRWHKLRQQIRTRMWESGPSVLASAAAQYSWEGRCEWKQLGAIPLLLDGAHNEASSQALRKYLDACIASTPELCITWIISFSNGKDVRGMLQALLKPRNGVKHRVALVPFSTPVEGMPWVKPMDPSSCVPEVRSMGVLHVVTFPSIVDALSWASQSCSGPHIVVVCGSLYLVSDYYKQATTSS